MAGRATTFRTAATVKQVTSSGDGSSKAFEPQIRVGQSGSTLRMRGALGQHEVPSLLLSINMCDITRVDSFTFSGEGIEDLTVEQPAFLSRTMHVKAGVPNGSSPRERYTENG